MPVFHFEDMYHNFLNKFLGGKYGIKSHTVLIPPAETADISYLR